MNLTTIPIVMALKDSRKFGYVNICRNGSVRDNSFMRVCIRDNYRRARFYGNTREAAREMAIGFAVSQFENCVIWHNE